MKYILQTLLAFVFVALCISAVPHNEGVQGLYLEKDVPASADKLTSQNGSFISVTDEEKQNLSSEQMHTIYIWDKQEGRILLTVRDYLIGVLAAEMPASYDVEALKAQAVASRTYLYYKMINGGCSRAERCAICTGSGHCQGYLSLEQRKQRWGEHFDEYEQKLSEAVELTEKQYLTYNGQIINAMYHSSSYGTTESYSDVYGGNNKYLISVDTPESKEQAVKRKTVSISELILLLKESYSDKSINESTVKNDFKILSYTPNGRVAKIKIGDITISGSRFAALVGLKSTDFYFKCFATNVNFVVMGSGHGVGMSQVGAGILAKSNGYEDILKHYYTSVELEDDQNKIYQTLNYLDDKKRADK